MGKSMRRGLCLGGEEAEDVLLGWARLGCAVLLVG